MNFPLDLDFFEAGTATTVQHSTASIYFLRLVLPYSFLPLFLSRVKAATGMKLFYTYPIPRHS
jgi:hypothetical protein